MNKMNYIMVHYPHEHKTKKVSLHVSNIVLCLHHALTNMFHFSTNISKLFRLNNVAVGLRKNVM